MYKTSRNIQKKCFPVQHVQRKIISKLNCDFLTMTFLSCDFLSYILQIAGADLAILKGGSQPRTKRGCSNCMSQFKCIDWQTKRGYHPRNPLDPPMDWIGVWLTPSPSIWDYYLSDELYVLCIALVIYMYVG